MPTICGRDGDTVYVHGSVASRMLRTLGKGASACLTVTLIDGIVAARSGFHSSMNYRSVHAAGPAPPGRRPRRERRVRWTWSSTTCCPAAPAELRGPTEIELRQTVVLALPIEEGSAKVRTGGPKDDEADLDGDAWAGVLPLRAGGRRAGRRRRPARRHPAAAFDQRLPAAGPTRDRTATDRPMGGDAAASGTRAPDGVPASPPPERRQPRALDPLKERNYRLFFIGNVTSNMGTFCQSIAQSLLVYQLTGSTFLVGVVNFAQFAAVPVLAPAAGAAADRFDRRRLLIVTQVAAFGVAGAPDRAGRHRGGAGVGGDRAGRCARDHQRHRLPDQPHAGAGADQRPQPGPGHQPRLGVGEPGPGAGADQRRVHRRQLRRLLGVRDQRVCRTWRSPPCWSSSTPDPRRPRPPNGPASSTG